MTIEEKIKIIEESNSFGDIPLDALPSSHKDNYYFVSYSHKDYKTVFKDILRLEEMGVNIWYDNEMHIGENWREIAQLYISKFQCSGVIFYLTENSISSPACNQEVEYVLTHNKKFLSINKPLDGCGMQSGYSMLKELQKRGLNCEQSLLDNFKKAFPNEVLYLGIDESIEKKAHQITSIEREDLLQVETVNSWSTNKTELMVSSCRDNTIINLDLSKIYDVDGITDNIKIIGDCVFTNSIKLQNVSISNKLYKIGESAFRNCNSLTTLDLSGVESIEIGKKSFMNCSSLKEIDLSKAKKVEESAFEGCSLLDIKTLNGEISGNAFYKTKIESIDYIASDARLTRSAFWGCKTLKSFNIRGKFTQDLGESVFYGCESLESVGPFIAPWSFDHGCNKTIKIGAYAFDGCQSLKSIKITGGWDLSKSDGAFWGCSSLAELDLDVSGDAIPYSFARGCKSLTSVTNSERFTVIGEEAFEDCVMLNSFDLTNAQHIDKAAFVGSGVERIYLKNIKTIAKSAFANCKSLKSVYIGKECEKIEGLAFLGCSSLHTVKILSENVKFGKDNDTFEYSNNIKAFYLVSKEVFDEIKEGGILEKLSVLYIGEGVDISELDLQDFDKAESDEGGFYKFVAREKEVFVDPEDAIDITSNEINEPDSFSPNYKHKNEDAFVEFMAKDVIIKHRRLKNPHTYFVEQVELFEDEMTIDYLVVSTHTKKSFKIDGSLIEDIQRAPKTIGDWFKIDDTNELNEKSCCIIGNGEYHYCTVKIVNCNPVPLMDENLNFKYAVEVIIFIEDDEIKAISGIDIDSITVFNDDFETEKVIERASFKPF